MLISGQLIKNPYLEKGNIILLWNHYLINIIHCCTGYELWAMSLPMGAVLCPYSCIIKQVNPFLKKDLWLSELNENKY